MTLRLYMDENRAERRLARQLQAGGIEVVRFVDVGMVGAEDEAQLEYASAHGMAVYSADSKDFPRLHWEWLGSGRVHTGIIVVPLETPVGAQIRALLAIDTVLGANEPLGMVLIRLADWLDM